MLELKWRGPVFGQSGYEVLSRGLLVALDELGVRVNLTSAWEWNLERTSLPFNHVSRLQRMMKTKVRENVPLVMHQRLWEGAKEHEGPKFIYSLFETDQVPSPWRAGFQSVNGVITFTEWNRMVWVKDGLDPEKVHSVGGGIEIDAFDPKMAQSANIVNRRGYTFLANGDWVERKNWDLLIEAYCKEFKPSEEVTLIIKSHYGGFVKVHKDALYSAIRNRAKHWTKTPPRILILSDKLAEEEMPKLYASANCFVLPSRGEGLCLPVLEAMASGMPVITTGWGGQAEYIREDGEDARIVNRETGGRFFRYKKGILLPYTLELIRDVEFIKKCPHAVGHRWAETHVDDLRTAMRWCFDNRPEAVVMGTEARQSLRRETWHKAAIKLLQAVYKPAIKILKAERGMQEKLAGTAGVNS